MRHTQTRLLHFTSILPKNRHKNQYNRVHDSPRSSEIRSYVADIPRTYTQLVLAMKQKAVELGFGPLGITSHHPSKFMPQYLQWIQNNYHGEMGYLARQDRVQRRQQMELILPQMKTVIMTSLFYWPGLRALNRNDLKMSSSNNGTNPVIASQPSSDFQSDHPLRVEGTISCYAWGVDYHKVFDHRLKQLAVWIHDTAAWASSLNSQAACHPNTATTTNVNFTIPQHSLSSAAGEKERQGEAALFIPDPHDYILADSGAAKWFADTGAVMERDLAMRSGLGFIGKNTMLINEKFGSGFFIGEIFTTLPLPPTHDLGDLVENHEMNKTTNQAYTPDQRDNLFLNFHPLPDSNQIQTPLNQVQIRQQNHRGDSNNLHAFAPSSAERISSRFQHPSNSDKSASIPAFSSSVRKRKNRKSGGCGKCTKCMTACPTQAFVDDRILDARKCISYLTIELKTSIPEELRPMMGNRIYGCDVCQQVCPWNRFEWEDDHGQGNSEHEEKTNDNCSSSYLKSPLFGSVSTDFAFPNLLDLINISEEDFQQRFKDTAIKRIGRQRLRRNVAVALGNSKNVNVIPSLEIAAKDPDELVAEHALWALRNLKSELKITS